MTVSIDDGVLGLEATWAFNAMTMNETQSGTFPRARFITIDGAHGTGDSTDPSDPADGRIGEVPNRSQLSGKSITFTGVMEAMSLHTMRAAVAALRNAASLRTDTVMVVTPHADYGTIPFTFVGRPIAFTCPDTQDRSPQALPSPYSRQFILTFRARDPRAFALADTVTVSVPAATPTTITPGGLAPTEPYFVLAGPASAVTLTNNDSGRKVTFADLPLLSGHDLVVDFGGATGPHRKMTIDGVDVSGYIDWSNTDWFDDDTYGLAPSANSVTVTGTAGTLTAAPAVF